MSVSSASSAFSWTPHRFSGGVLALDVANSVVLRFDAGRRIDRFADGTTMDAFAAAAAALSGDLTQATTVLPVPPDDHPRFLRLREAIDGHFRAVAAGQEQADRLADLLEAIAGILRGSDGGADRLDVLTARSALALIHTVHDRPIRICPNCQWLFLDLSRNRSRTWCDMRVCGNRQKARRHYHSHRAAKP